MYDNDGKCALCHRQHVELTAHHLIPKSEHNKKRHIKRFGKQQMRTRLAMLCRPCHSFVHATFSNQQLANTYHDIEVIAQHEDIKKFVEWIESKPAELKVRTRR